MISENYNPQDHPAGPWGNSVYDLKINVLEWSGKAGDTATLGVTTEWIEQYSQVYRMSPLSIVVSTSPGYASPGSDFVPVAEKLSWGFNELNVTKTFQVQTKPNSPGETDESFYFAWRYDTTHIPESQYWWRGFGAAGEIVIKGGIEGQGDSGVDPVTGLPVGEIVIQDGSEGGGDSGGVAIAGRPVARQIFKGTDVVKDLGVTKARKLAQSILDKMDTYPGRFEGLNDWLYKKLSPLLGTVSDKDISRIRRNIRATGGIRG